MLASASSSGAAHPRSRSLVLDRAEVAEFDSIIADAAALIADVGAGPDSYVSTRFDAGVETGWAADTDKSGYAALRVSVGGDALLIGLVADLLRSHGLIVQHTEFASGPTAYRPGPHAGATAPGRGAEETRALLLAVLSPR